MATWRWCHKHEHHRGNLYHYRHTTATFLNSSLYKTHQGVPQICVLRHSRRTWSLDYTQTPVKITLEQPSSNIAQNHKDDWIQSLSREWGCRVGSSYIMMKALEAEETSVYNIWPITGHLGESSWTRCMAGITSWLPVLLCKTDEKEDQRVLIEMPFGSICSMRNQNVQNERLRTTLSLGASVSLRTSWIILPWTQWWKDTNFKEPNTRRAPPQHNPPWSAWSHSTDVCKAQNHQSQIKCDERRRTRITLWINKNNGQDHCIPPLYLGRQWDNWNCWCIQTPYSLDPIQYTIPNPGEVGESNIQRGVLVCRSFKPVKIW